MNKPRISVAFVQNIYHIRFFFWQKGKLVLRSLLLEGRYFRGDRYFRRVVTFGTVYTKNRK